MRFTMLGLNLAGHSLLGLVFCEIVFKEELLTEKDEIKFYVYEELNWYKICEKDSKNKLDEHKKSPEYGAEIEFLSQIENHPWRTWTPEDAKVFVVPVMWAYLNLDLPCGDYKTQKDDDPHPRLRELEKMTAASLFNSEFYKKSNGQDHMILATHKEIRWPLFQDKIWLSVLENITVAYYEQLPFVNMSEGSKFGSGYPDGHSNFWACTVPIPYKTETIVKQETAVNINDTIQDWFKRKHTFGFIGDWNRSMGPRKYSKGTLNLRARFNDIFSQGPSQSKTLEKYSSLFIKTSKGSKVAKKCDLNSTSKSCTNCYIKNDTSNYPEMMNNVNYGLVFPGESPDSIISSHQLYGAISSFSIPIIIADSLMELHLPFLWKVSWRDMIYFVPESDERSIMTDQLKWLGKYLKINKKLLKSKLKAIKKFRKEVLWSMPGNNVVKNIILEVYMRCIE